MSDCASADMTYRGMMLSLLFRLNQLISIPHNLHHLFNLHHLLNLYHQLIPHQSCNPLPQHKLHPLFNHHRLHLPFSIIHHSTWQHPLNQGRLSLVTLHPAGWSPVCWGLLLSNTAASCRPAPQHLVVCSPTPTLLKRLWVQSSRGEMRWIQKQKQTHTQVQRNPLHLHLLLEQDQDLKFIHHSWNSWKWQQR